VSQTLARAKVYRNLELRQQLVGLEPFDALGLGALLWVLMVFNRPALGWNLLFLIAAYAALRVVKRGKPEGYTTSVLRFYFARRPFFSAAARDQNLQDNPFPSAPRGAAPESVRRS
jgi:hypothetical protein